MYGTVVFALLLSLSSWAAWAPGSTNWSPQGFFFDWNPPGTSIPIPTTQQCDVIHIKWSRSTATGPDPVAPYFLQIYTSTFIVPFVIPVGRDPFTDFPVPFVPGTQYMICMIDSKGTTGGCQDIYTVYPAPGSSPPTCTNLTYPAKAMDVDSNYRLGSLSQYGWPDQCSDISVQPKEGTPPFTFTIAPALHPPLNITSNSMAPVNWTVSLSHGSPFFISLVDSTGLSWSNGPLHSGDGPVDCLAGDIMVPKSGISVAAIVSSSIGGVAFGVVVAFLIMWFLKRRTDRSNKPIHSISPFLDPGSRPNASSTSPLDENHSLRSGRTRPTIPSPSDSRSPLAESSDVEPLSGSDAQFPLRTRHRHAESNLSDSPTGRGGNVYVVHHDAGRPPPVTVFTTDGARVLELPPMYGSVPDPTTNSDLDSPPVESQPSTRDATRGVEQAGQNLGDASRDVRQVGPSLVDALGDVGQGRRVKGRREPKTPRTPRS